MQVWFVVKPVLVPRPSLFTWQWEVNKEGLGTRTGETLLITDIIYVVLYIPWRRESATPKHDTIPGDLAPSAYISFYVCSLTYCMSFLNP